MSHHSFDVISVGSSLRDIMFYAQTGVITQKQVWELQYGGKVMSDRVFIEFGGGGANTSVNFARLGLHAGIISTVGTDEYGESIVSHLKKEHVDTTYIHKSQLHTGFSFILVHQRTGEHIAFIHYGAAEECVLPERIQDIQTDWYYVSSINSKNWKKTLRTVFATQARIAWNPGSTQLKATERDLKPLLRRTDVLILNEQEAEHLSKLCGKREKKTPQRIRSLQSLGPRIVVITRGRFGSLAYDGINTYAVPRIKEKPVDTTGAGDSYGSAFVAGLIRYSGDIHKSMELATLSAAANVHIIGAQEGLLSWNQLPQRLRA